MPSTRVISTTIPANEALSGGIDIGDAAFVGIEMPEGWAGTQITFQAKAKNKEDVNNDPALEDYDNVYDSAGNELVVTVAANRIVTDIPELSPLRFIRIRSGTSGTPVNQNPAREIRIIAK